MKKLLIIGYVWPEPNSSAAGSRMLQLIDCFLYGGWHITFACAASETDHMTDLKALDIDKVAIELNSSSFDHFITEVRPDAVMFDRFVTEEQYSWRVEKNYPNALRIVDSEDLHFLRDARYQAHKHHREFTDADLYSDMAKREVAAIQRSDLTLVISEFEIELLHDKFKIDSELLHYTPFMVAVDQDEFKPLNCPGFSQREHFISIGNFRHAPNWDAVQFLKQTIWPLIRKQLPKAELHIYGAYPPRKATDLHNPREGFHVLGWAEDSIEVMQQARVCLAPLRFGAGLKGKLLEAMQCGTPFVTTKIGEEGMSNDSFRCSPVEDDPKAFAQAAVDLYESESLWKKCQENGRVLLGERFNKATHGEHLLTRIEQVIAHLESHRLNNFTGAMLRHHSMRSTEYMAQWIEAKNKLKQSITH